MLAFGPCFEGPTVRLEDGLVVFLALATGGVLLAGLAQAFEGRRRPPRPRARPRPDAHPGGAAPALPTPPTEARPASDPSADEAPVGAPSDHVPRPGATGQDVHATGVSESGAPVGEAPALAAPAGAKAGTVETREVLAGGRDAPALRPGADEVPDTPVHHVTRHKQTKRPQTCRRLRNRAK